MRDLSSLYRPDAIAVIGASDSRGKVGNAVVRNLMHYGFGGEIYPVNPNRDTIEGLKCYPSVAEIGAEVQQAVICIPAPIVPDAMRDCGEAGVRSVVVITAGFKESGPEGAALEEEIIRIADGYGINMMGPNCLGVMDTHTPINASFAADFPLKGNIAFFSQSGALCIAILDWSLEQQLGFSKFISMGNKAQLHEGHFIADAATDPDTRVILLYLESVEDGEAFVEAAKDAAREKPVIVLKSGVSEAGAKAASSHTGALAGSDEAFTAAFRQGGILRARTMEEQFIKAMAFSRDRVLPEGRRVAVITNAGGPGVMAVDALEPVGLEMARFSEETTRRLRDGLPDMASIENPVDVVGHADADRYRFGLETVCSDPGVDMVLAVLTPTAVLDALGVAQHIIRISELHPDKAVVAAFGGGVSVDRPRQLLRSRGIPCFQFPEEAVTCFAAMVEYSEARARLSEGEPVIHEGDGDRVREVFGRVRCDGRRILLGPEAMEVAEAYGISTVPSRLATSESEAGDLAAEMGFPVVLKVASPDIIHKTDIGGVQLGLEDREAVEEAYRSITTGAAEKEPDARVYGVEVQKMFPPGQELIVGLTDSPEFGPLLMFGLGGIFVDLMKDVSFRIVRGITDVDIDEMVRETMAFQLLQGYRGEPRKDLDAVKDTVGRIAQLARDFPEVQELDINPFFAYEKGVAALDVKITLSDESG